jgi:Tol biopolymer transport system component
MSQHKLTCAQLLRRVTALPLLLTLVLSSASAGAASEETVGDTFPVSVTPQGVYANDEGTTVYGPVSISDDGRYVAFQSTSTNLGVQGPSGAIEGYVKDLHSGEVELVSRADGVHGQPAGEPGVENVKISGDGRYVIFNSKASNLVSGLPEEEPTEQHVYRRDLQTGETALVDRVSGLEGAILSREAVAEAISRDGRYVVFAADVNNLEDPNAAHAKTSTETVYVRDIQTGVTTAVSRASGPDGELANQESEGYSISPDGRQVAFLSRATNLVPGMESNIFQQVYLRDLQTGTTTLLSRGSNGQAGEGRSENPVLVGEAGCEIQFNSEATDLLSSPSIEINGEPITISGPQVYLADLCSTEASVALLSQDQAGIAGDAYGAFGGSADGSEILFAGEFASGYHLFLRDLDSGQTMQLDRSSGPEGESADRESEQAAISANGCRAVFDTTATNLVGQTGPPEGPNGEKPTEVYARQLAACNEEPTMNPTSLSFPTQALGTIGQGQLVTVTAGSEALQIHDVQPSGTDGSDFILTSDECTGETLEPAEKCTLMVRFAPSATGSLTASLVVHAGPANPTMQIALSGEGGQLPLGGRGPTGQTGQPGPQGSSGAQGARGSAGEKGTPGRAGDQVKVSCKLTAHHRITCKVAIKGKPANSAMRALLSKSGRTYARGSLADLRPAATIERGYYSLRLFIEGHARAIWVRLS